VRYFVEAIRHPATVGYRTSKDGACGDHVGNCAANTIPDLLLRGFEELIVVLSCEPENDKAFKMLERETGVEPATSSLGKWRSIENKDYAVFGASFWR
jgi:hypothetical protein